VKLLKVDFMTDRLDIEAVYRLRNLENTCAGGGLDQREAARERLRKMREKRYALGLTARGKAPIRADWSLAKKEGNENDRG
jgi:hypothetical protein